MVNFLSAQYALSPRPSLLHHSHLKRCFTHAAIRASPVVRNIFPRRAGGDAFIRQPQRFFINKTTNKTFPNFHCISLIRPSQCAGGRQSKTEAIAPVCCNAEC